MEWLGTKETHELKLMLTPTATQTLHDLTKPKGSICLLIGCEGGFSPAEQTAAANCGFTGIQLGKRILRTETAALAALAAMQALWGDF
jgi:16S rRNA (uracil1498-N3)-methyltransferase